MSERPALNMKRPMTKAARLSVIEDVLLKHIVTSQQQLLIMLAVKTRKADGSVAYELPLPPHTHTSSATDASGSDTLFAPAKEDPLLSKTLTGMVLSVAAAGNIVVLHTPSGAAQYLGSVLDRANLDSVLGTIAGDDTVMVVTSDADGAQRTAQRLLSLAVDQRSAGASDAPTDR